MKLQPIAGVLTSLAGAGTCVGGLLAKFMFGLELTGIAEIGLAIATVGAAIEIRML